VHALAQNYFNSGVRCSIPRNDCWKQAICDGHDARNDDLTSLLLADLPHAANADAQVIKHPLRDGNELPACCGDSDPTGAAIEKPDADDVLDPLDGSAQGWLRSLQKRGCSNEAVVFRDSEDRMQLTRCYIRNVVRRHWRFMQKSAFKLITETI
jgi:hypothetical protein